MLMMRLQKPLGQFPAGVVLEFGSVMDPDLHPGDIVLCGLNCEELFPHVVTKSGGLTPFGCVVGEYRNIKYKALAVTTRI